MNFCHCTLAGTKACKYCSSNKDYDNDHYNYQWVTKESKKKITKEYDEKGNLIKETIEDI